MEAKILFLEQQLKSLGTGGKWTQTLWVRCDRPQCNNNRKILNEIDLEKNIFYLYIYGLFNDALTISDCIAQNDRMMSE
jgi:hypothetical protein